LPTAAKPLDLLVPLLADPPDLAVLSDEASWNLVKLNAARYGVAALVAGAARLHVSSSDRAWCDGILARAWGRHERMLRNLEYILSLLSGAGIPAIALKGPLLAQRYYSPAFLRKPSMDLDLAVAARNLDAACDVLLNAGYKPETSVAEAIARSHHLELSHKSLPKLELHFRLSHMSYGIPVDEFFDRAVIIALPSGQKALVLGPADQILHLVLHLAQSRFGTLFHLAEVRRVYSAESPAARAEAIRRAVEHRFRGVLRMTDIAFRARLGQPFLPSEFTLPDTWLHWRLNERLYRAFERWSTPGRKWTPATRLWGRWLDFQLTDTPSDALRSLKLLAVAARFPNARHAWATKKPVVYGPDYSVQNDAGK
jgi:hypothetical protein